MTAEKKISQLQETLTSLYLRLNGYFTSSLILHSETKGAIRSELDRIGIRFPLHQQPEREIGFSTFLNVPNDKIDLVIVEVKNGNSSLRFNDPLVKRENESVSNWKKILRWVGAFSEDDLNILSEQLTDLVQPDGNYNFQEFRKIEYLSRFGHIQIRPILVAFGRPLPRNGQLRYINGSIILDYIWDCFNPMVPRQDCATQYDFGSWGEYLQIVKFVKDRYASGLGKAELSDYYQALL